MFRLKQKQDDLMVSLLDCGSDCIVLGHTLTLTGPVFIQGYVKMGASKLSGEWKGFLLLKTEKLKGALNGRGKKGWVGERKIPPGNIPYM